MKSWKSLIVYASLFTFMSPAFSADSIPVEQQAQTPKVTLHQLLKKGRRFYPSFLRLSAAASRGPASAHDKKAGGKEKGISKQNEAEKDFDQIVDAMAALDKLCARFIELNSKKGDLSEEALKALQEAASKVDKDGNDDPLVQALEEAMKSLGKEKDSEYQAALKAVKSLDSKALSELQEKEGTQELVKNILKGRQSHLKAALNKPQAPKNAKELESRYLNFLNLESTRVQRLSKADARRYMGALVLAADLEDHSGESYDDMDYLEKKFPQIFQQADNKMSTKMAVAAIQHGEVITKYSGFTAKNMLLLTITVALTDFANDAVAGLLKGLQGDLKIELVPEPAPANTKEL
jgi:hypothetical protein